MKTATTEPDSPAFELKGSVLTAMVLHLRETDPQRLYPALEKKLGQARSFFNNAPVVVDLQNVPGREHGELDLIRLAETLRSLGLVPVGVRGLVAEFQERALQSGMGLLPTVKGEKATTPPADESAGDPQPAAAVSGTRQPTRVISRPVRSGQQVIAAEGDLVILASVNAGAEVLAAGSIHVYGALRGRALAGIDGDEQARIYSLQCNPELVSVAGTYVVNEALEVSLINRSVMISHTPAGLHFAILDTPN